MNKRGTLKQRFWRYVAEAPNGCWTWTGAQDSHGYGVIGTCEVAGKTSKIVKAHRVAYELVFGPVPAGRLLRHVVCANPQCVNPAHLLPGTHRDNYHDAVRDGRPMGRRRKVA